ncbi:hypothetical protein HPB47_013908 [Ixodes persulcatus]|uniref:Uncharacterized protein n=1 Tax=Ixodes persulcatus TaxID=34615 RepID=A0AC60QYQ0_IXOPE|nr:hypothetical protein HPB47_013908 [Ixodes persulcatus]
MMALWSRGDGRKCRYRGRRRGSRKDAPLMGHPPQSSVSAAFAGDTEPQRCWTAPTACLRRCGRLHGRPPCESNWRDPRRSPGHPDDWQNLRPAQAGP